MGNEDRKTIISPEADHKAEKTLTTAAGYIIIAVLAIGLADHYLTEGWHWVSSFWLF